MLLRVFILNVKLTEMMDRYCFANDENFVRKCFTKKKKKIYRRSIISRNENVTRLKRLKVLFAPKKENIYFGKQEILPKLSFS